MGDCIYLPGEVVVEVVGARVAIACTVELLLLLPPLLLPILELILGASQLPKGGLSLLPLVTTSGPGLGYLTSVPLGTVQPLPRLAIKIAGRTENATTARSSTSRLARPLMILTAAQFI